MSSKILLADDSLTIQKVIKITLSNEPYQILDCRNELELINLVGKKNIDLVLLDFGLSEEKSGYLLAKKLKEISPTTKILMMFGTFDTVDEKALKDSGATDKIVKPFDSTKFINICRSILQNDSVGNNLTDEWDDFDDEADQNDQLVLPSDNQVNDTLPDEDWVIDQDSYQAHKAAPDQSEVTQNEFSISDDLNEIELDLQNDQDINNSQTTEFDGRVSLNKLAAEVSGWGISVPPLLNQDVSMNEDDFSERPPVLEDLSRFGESQNLGKTEEKKPVLNVTSNKKAHLISLDELSLNEVNKKPKNDSPQEDDAFAIFDFEEKEQTSHTQNIQDQIKDEVSATDFWSENKSETQEFEAKTSPVNSKFNQDDVDLLFPQMIKSSESAGIDDINADRFDSLTRSLPSNQDDVIKYLLNDFSERIELKLRPILKGIVAEFCKESIERVAWEIIPSLAENIIHTEIDKILNRQSKKIS